MDDLRKLVSNFMRQKIPSFRANFYIILRFEEVRKYSSVKVRDPHRVLYVPLPVAPPAMAVPLTLNPKPKLLKLMVQKFAAVFD